MKTMTLLTGILTALALSTTALQADVLKGQKLYLKKLKSKCDASGAKMAAMYSMDEWAEFKEDGTLGDKLIQACPKAEKVITNEKFQEKIMPHLYDFFYEYANDSGNVPSC